MVLIVWRLKVAFFRSYMAIFRNQNNWQHGGSSVYSRLLCVVVWRNEEPVWRKEAAFLTGRTWPRKISLSSTNSSSIIDIISIVRPGQHFLANSPAANLIISDLIWCVRINTSYILWQGRSLRTHFSLTKLSSYMDFSHLWLMPSTFGFAPAINRAIEFGHF